MSKILLGIVNVLMGKIQEQQGLIKYRSQGAAVDPWSITVLVGPEWADEMPAYCGFGSPCNAVSCNRQLLIFWMTTSPKTGANIIRRWPWMP
ncbi:hypothetical protein FA13DRAFT_1735996 [Coprinellus micaceus]|uniref:Uncharacterized protein n=1 Tax=Coprinellus micaceus TaxID=71717 RepID=A0A4Y7T1R6_COPMI|nr:hypothetical protein FA13DRAFT_1735996 [Coprinellus micaceus]